MATKKKTNTTTPTAVPGVIITGVKIPNTLAKLGNTSGVTVMNTSINDSLTESTDFKDTSTAKSIGWPLELKSNITGWVGNTLNPLLFYKTVETNTFNVPTITSLKNAIKNPQVDAYNGIIDEGGETINGASIKGGLGHILAYGEKPMVFTSGAGRASYATINNARTVSAMPIITYASLYQQSSLAARDLGDIKLVGNFELEYCGPLDARTVTPSRATLKNPDWWITSSTKPVYLYRGMIVSIQASQELVMYRGADTIIKRNNAEAISALDDNKWTLICPGSGNQILDDGNPVTLNSTVINSLNGGGKITLDSSVTASAANGIEIISFANPDTGTNKKYKDTTAKINVSAYKDSANVSINVYSEDNNAFKYKGIWDLNAGILLEGTQNSSINTIKHNINLTKDAISLFNKVDSSTKNIKSIIKLYNSEGIKLVYDSSINIGKDENNNSSIYDIEKNGICLNSSGIAIESEKNINVNVSNNQLKIDSSEINISGNLSLWSIPIDYPSGVNVVPYLTYGEDDKNKEKPKISWKHSGATYLIYNNTARRGIFKIGESVCMITTSDNVNAYNRSSLELELMSSAYKGKVRIDFTISKPIQSSKPSNNLIISDNTTNLNGGKVFIYDDAADATYKPTGSINQLNYEDQKGAIDNVGVQLQATGWAKQTNLYSIAINKTIVSSDNYGVSVYQDSKNSPIIVQLSLISENQRNYKTYPPKYRVHIEVFLNVPPYDTASFSTGNLIGNWDISGNDELTDVGNEESGSNVVINNINNGPEYITIYSNNNQLETQTAGNLTTNISYIKSIQSLPDVVTTENNSIYFLQYDSNNINSPMRWIPDTSIPNNINYKKVNESGTDIIKYHIFGYNVVSSANDALQLKGDLRYCDNLYYDQHGDLYAGNYYTTSDERFKDNIENISIKDDKVPNFKQFNWKESGEFTYGLIAQEVEKDFPELVHTEEKSTFKTVNYTAAFSYMINYLLYENKQLKDEIVKIKNEIAEIKNFN